MSDADNKHQPEESLKLISEIDKILGLGEKSLAKVNEAEEIAKKTREYLNQNLQPESELGREYEKWSKGTWYKTMSRDGFANSSHLAPLNRLREFLVRFLRSNEIEITSSQKYIRTGDVYSGRKFIRSIISKAKISIDMQDNYLDHAVFAILEPYFQNNTGLNARLLTSTNVKKSFKSDYFLFASQFGRVEAKIYNQVHGRFIIIDSTDIFSVGHSIKDMGKKADVVSKLEDTTAMQQVIEDFENWWTNGIEIKP